MLTLMTKADVDQQRREKQRAEIKRYEADNDIVPGSASHDGKQPRGGTEWEGRARMALARKAAGVRLDSNDRIAIESYPTPRSGLTA